MTDPTDPDITAHRAEGREAASAALVLATELKTFRHEVTDLKSTTRKNRNLIRLLGASVLFDLILSVALGWVAIRASEASSEAKAATTATAIAERQGRTACESNNEARRDTRELWQFLFTFPPPPRETEEEKARRLESTAKFNAYLDKATVQRDCSVAR